MSSDPADYIQAYARPGRQIAVALRQSWDNCEITYDLPREDALRLVSDLGHVLFATACLEPRPARQAEPAPAIDTPATDNDEIPAVVGALAALTDRVRTLEEGCATPCDTEIDKRIGSLEAHASIARQNFKTGKERLDTIDERVGSLTERTDSVTSCLERLYLRHVEHDDRLEKLAGQHEARATPSAVTPDAGEAGDPGSRPQSQTLKTHQSNYTVTTYGGTSDSEKRLHQELYDLLCRFPGVTSVHATRVVEAPRR